MSFEEQDTYPSIFSPQMETTVFINLQIFYATRAVLKIGVYLVNKPLPAAGISAIIIQQIVTLSKYGHDALDIRHP